MKELEKVTYILLPPLYLVKKEIKKNMHGMMLSVIRPMKNGR
jgi:hypothetical protein